MLKIFYLKIFTLYLFEMFAFMGFIRNKVSNNEIYIENFDLLVLLL